MMFIVVKVVTMFLFNLQEGSILNYNFFVCASQFTHNSLEKYDSTADTKIPIIFVRKDRIGSDRNKHFYMGK